MSELAKIKAMQLAEAAGSGENPYAATETVIVPAAIIEQQTPIAPETASWSVLSEIKAKQQVDADKSGINPYLIGFDMASGTDRTVMIAAPVGLAHYQDAMGADLAHLSTIKDIVEKSKAKKTMIATYWDFVKAYVDNGDNYPNDIAVRVMIWLFDTLDIERGLDLAFHLIKQGIHVSPPKFDRDLPTFICDAMYDWSAALLKMDPPQSACPYLDTLVATIDNDQWSLAPPVQSKMYAILAKHKARTDEWHMVLALCERAEQVNPEGAGVKGLKTNAQKELKSLAGRTAEQQ